MKKNRPATVYFIIGILTLVGLNGWIAGIGLFIFPDGRWIGLQLSWLNGSPFNSFRIPGLLLFLFIGVGCLFTAVGLLFRPSWQWPQQLNVFPDKFWAWSFSIYCGFMLCIWIITQQVLTDYFFLQPAINGLGVCLLILTLLPATQVYYKTPARHIK